jgi:hypothetical protein
VRILIGLALCLSAIAQTAKFPSTVATDGDLKVVKNRLETKLKSAATTSDTTIVVDSTTGFTANMLVTVDNEIIAICGVSGANNLTVGHSACPNVDGRGFDGTTAATHSIGKKASAFVDAWHFSALAAEIKAVETTLGAGMSKVPTPITVTSYGAVCDATASSDGTDDTAAFTAVEALTDKRDIYLPPGFCSITNSLFATLKKHYTGPGKILVRGTGGAALGPDYFVIRTAPDVGAGGLGNFQGDQRGVWAKYFQTAAGSNIGSPTSPYFNYTTNPVYIKYDANDGASGFDTLTTGTSNSGQPVLTVRSTVPFTVGKQVVLTGETRTILSIQAGVSLTMTANLSQTHSAGEYVTMKNRTSQSNIFLEHVNTAGGDSQTLFLAGYANNPPGTDVRHWSQNATTTLVGGSLGASAHFNGMIGEEILYTDQNGAGEWKTNAVGLIHNFNRYIWAGQVNTATSGKIITWVSGGKFDTGWAASTAITINGVGYTIASVTDTTHAVLNEDPGNQSNKYYRVDPAVGVNGSWTGMYFTSGGTQYAEQVFQGAGKWKRGFSTVGMTFEASQAALILAPDHRIYYNGSTVADADVGYTLWTKTPGDVYTAWNSALSQFQLIVQNVNTLTSTNANVYTGTGIHMNVGGDLLVTGNITGGANANLPPPCYGTTGTFVPGCKLVLAGATLSGGAATITLTGSSVYTSGTSYRCTANDETAANAVKITRTSGSSIGLTGTGTDNVSVVCWGN